MSALVLTAKARNEELLQLYKEAGLFRRMGDAVSAAGKQVGSGLKMLNDARVAHNQDWAQTYRNLQVDRHAKNLDFARKLTRSRSDAAPVKSPFKTPQPTRANLPHRNTSQNLLDRILQGALRPIASDMDAWDRHGIDALTRL